MNQKKIWDHFQGPGIDGFTGSIPRLRFLLKQATKVSCGRYQRVLNIGTGNGWLEVQCAEHGWKITGLDPSEIAIAKLAKHNILSAVGLIEAIPYARGLFDSVFCSEVFEHLSEEQFSLGLKEIIRVLRTGGYLIGTVPFNETLSAGQVKCPGCGIVFHRWGHQQSFDTKSMRTALEGVGLGVIAIDSRAFPFFSESSIKNYLKTIVIKVLGRFGTASVYPFLFFMGQKL